MRPEPIGDRLELKGKTHGKYLVWGNYVGDGVKGLMEEGGKAAIESVGGSLESMYFALRLSGPPVGVSPLSWLSVLAQ